MLKRMFAAADIEGIAVRQEDFAAELLDIVRHNLGILRAEIGEVTELPEVNFDSGKIVFKMNGFKACALHQPVKLLGKGFAGCSVKISEVYCRFFHGIPLSSKVSFILSYAQKVVKKEYTGQKSRQKSAALTGFCFLSQQQGNDSQENEDKAVDENAAVRDILRLAAHGVNKGFAAVLDGELAYE